VASVRFQAFADSSHEALLRDTCNARGVPCMLLNLPLTLQQSVALFNELWEQKLINNF